MSDENRHSMMCDVCSRMVRVVTCPGSKANTFRVVDCLDRNEDCYTRECAFTTDGADVPVEELKPFVGDGV